MADFSGLSPRCSIFTSMEDYVEGHMTNPTIPCEFKKVKTASVKLEKHVIVGSGSIIMPGITLKMGASVGALSFVNKDVPGFHIVGCTPIISGLIISCDSIYNVSSQNKRRVRHEMHNLRFKKQLFFH